LQNRVNHFKSQKGPWLATLILSPIPLILVAIAIGSMATTSGASEMVSTIITYSIILLNYGFFIFMFVRALKKRNAAMQEQKEYNTNNSNLKNKIHELFKNDSIPDETKFSKVEEWIKNYYSEHEKSEINRKHKRSKSMKTLAIIGSCIAGMIAITVAGVSFFKILNTKQEAREKAIAESEEEESRAIAESEAEESRAIAESEAAAAKAIEDAEVTRVVETFIEAAKNNDVTTMNACLAPNYTDRDEITLLLFPNSMNKSFLGLENNTPNQLSSDALDKLTQSTSYFCKNFIGSYKSCEIRSDYGGKYIIAVPAGVINMNNYIDIYKEKNLEIKSALSTTYADDLQEIKDTSSNENERLLKLWDFIISDVCEAIESSTDEAARQEVEITFIVEKVSGKYCITEIYYTT
jgi:hypothetical protein